MEIYTQQDDLILFGTQVKTFPVGIMEAFDSLMKVVGNERAYYGISWFDEDGNIIYYAMAPEMIAGEAKQYHYETLTLLKGNYLTETVEDWRSKTDSIKDVFQRLMADVRPNKKNLCIEWYQSDNKMLCMVKEQVIQNG